MNHQLRFRVVAVFVVVMLVGCVAVAFSWSTEPVDPIDRRGVATIVLATDRPDFPVPTPSDDFTSEPQPEPEPTPSPSMPEVEPSAEDTPSPSPTEVTPTAPATPEEGWSLQWSPQAREDGLDAFEGLEDDRADSHPDVKHIYVAENNYRFDMHTRDRDGSDRQRNEAKGMRTDGRVLEMNRGETWRFTYSMYIPTSLKATTTFTHIMQMKAPGSGGPIVVMSLRRTGSTPKIELKVFGENILVGAVDLQPLQNSWIDTEFEMTIGDAPRGAVRWVVRHGSKTLIDESKSGVDTWLEDRVRPKWGIYRSLGDSSGSLEDCYLLITNLRAYKHV